MHRVALIIVVFSMAGLVTVVSKSEAPPGTMAPKRVDVDVRCVGATFTIDVDPWTVELQQGDSTDWHLRPQATPSAIDVAPKRGGSWAYQSNNARRGTKDRPAQAQDMKGNQSGRRYKYNITAVCVQSDRTDTIVIDPDMVIR